MLFFGLICLAIGQNRKQHLVTSFVEGAFLGPVGVILVLFVSKRKEGKTDKGSLLCSHCGKYYQGNPNFCPNCGRRLKD